MRWTPTSFQENLQDFIVVSMCSEDDRCNIWCIRSWCTEIELFSNLKRSSYSYDVHLSKIFGTIAMHTNVYNQNACECTNVIKTKEKVVNIYKVLLSIYVLRNIKDSIETNRAQEFFRNIDRQTNSFSLALSRQNRSTSSVDILWRSEMSRLRVHKSKATTDQMKYCWNIQCKFGATRMKRRKKKHKENIKKTREHVRVCV